MRIFKCVSFIETLKKLKRSLKFDCINFEFNFWHTFIRFTIDIQNFHQCLVNTISYCFYCFYLVCQLKYDLRDAVKSIFEK